MKKVKKEQIEKFEKNLEIIKNTIKFYNNSAKVYLDVVKNTNVKRYYETRLKEYNEGLVLLKDFESIATKNLAKVQQKKQDSAKNLLYIYENTDFSSIQLSDAEKAEVEKEVKSTMKSMYFELQDRYTCIKKMEKFKAQVEEKTEEMKDEYLIQLDNLSRDGELDLAHDEYQLYLDRLTRESDEIERETFDANQDDAEKIKNNIQERKKKSKLLEDIEAVYAEEMERQL